MSRAPPISPPFGAKVIAERAATQAATEALLRSGSVALERVAIKDLLNDFRRTNTTTSPWRPVVENAAKGS